MRVVLIVFLFYLTSLFALDLNLPKSAYHNATQNLELAIPAVSSNNPAIIRSGAETSATYLFNLKEIPIYNNSFGYKFRNFGFQIGNTFLSHSLYKESITKISVNYQLKFVVIGFSARHLMNDVENFQKDSSLLFDVGMSWKLQNMQTAIAVKNFQQAEYLQSKLPIFYLWEMCYDFGKSKISFGMEKQKNFDFAFKLAGKYDVSKNLSMLSGYQYQPDRLSFGLIFRIKNTKLIYSIRTHQYLDFTHYITLGYSL